MATHRPRPRALPRRGRLLRWRHLLAMAALVLTAFTVTASSAAEEDLRWGVRPSSEAGPDGREHFDYQVAPGTVVSDWVAVTNHSAIPATFRVYAADAFTDYDTAAFTLSGSDESPTDVGAWTSLNGTASTCPDATREEAAACGRVLGTDVTLGPGERADIPFSVTVPYDAVPGDHAAGIVAVHTTEGPGEGGAQIRQETRTGTRIYLRVDGALEPALRVSGLVSGHDSSWIPFGRGTARIGFDVANTGNTIVSARPTVNLAGPFGISLGQWELPEVQNIVPGGTAHVAAELPAFATVLTNADITVEPFAPARATSADDPLPPGFEGSTRAWSLPWTGLALLVLLAGVPALVLWRRRRGADRLNAELAAYTESVRAEERARLTEPVDAVDQNTADQNRVTR